MKHCILAAVIAAAAFISTAAEVPLDLFSSQKHWRSAVKNKNMTYKFDGKEKCMRFFEPCLVKTQFMLPVDKFDKKFTGIIFKVKGDGSDNYGNLTISGTPVLGLRTVFPVKNTQWVEYCVAFKDMAPFSDFSTVPVTAVPGKKFYEIAIGDNRSLGPGNKKRSTFCYWIKDLRLTDREFAKNVPPPDAASLEMVIEKLRAKQPVKLLFLGDSITAGTGLKSPATQTYAAVLTEMLKKHFNNPAVSFRTGAVGGFHTYEVLSYLKRDLAAVVPDVVFVLIGYNSRNSGQNKEVYTAHMELLIKRINAETSGKSAIVLLPTVPGVPRFATQQDMAEACRQLAAKYKLTVVNIDKRIEEVGPEQYKAKYLHDSVHPNPEGHKFFAEKIMTAFK